MNRVSLGGHTRWRKIVFVVDRPSYIDVHPRLPFPKLSTGQNFKGSTFCGVGILGVPAGGARVGVDGDARAPFGVAIFDE